MFPSRSQSTRPVSAHGYLRAAAVLFLSLGAAAQVGAQQTGAEGAAAGNVGSALTGPYEVGPGDVLAISVFGYDDLSRDYPVRSDGTVGMHLLGRIDVAGLDLTEVETAISARALDAFSASPSVLVDVVRYRDVFVTGAVEAPGAYPYRPGLNVVQAVALAGGVRRSGEEAGTADDQRAFDAQRRVMQAQAALQSIDRRLAALDQELQRLDANAPATATADTEEARFFALGRERLERQIDQSVRQEQLAEAEAASMMQRRELIERQQGVVDEQLVRMEDLLSRGLSRAEQLMDLRLDADDYRSDALEAAAFEARARQTAANAQSAIEIARVDYRQRLLSERLTLTEDRETARAEYRTGLGYLEKSGAAAEVAALTSTVTERYDILRGDETLRGDLRTGLRPDDVLMLSVDILDTTSN